MKKVKPYIILHILLLVLSTGGIFSKLAARQPFFSLNFFLLYGCVILILGIYALLWQQMLKVIPLTVAYSNKAVTVIWSIIWGVLFFQETVTIVHFAGVALIVTGIVFMGSDQKNE